MTENEFFLADRIQKIQQIIGQYGEENFYISFSGGKDSTVLSALVDMAIPNNNIPRVYANTGIELNMIRDFVFEMAKTDKRVVVIKPSVPIKQMLEKEGYPFKSKVHSHVVNLYQIGSKNKMVLGYLGKRPQTWHSDTCPKILRYQFTSENALRISDACCVQMKENPLMKWANENNKQIAIIGIMREEGGRRTKSNCMVLSGQKVIKFQPLVPITKDWEEWLIKEKGIQICDIYKPPYNFGRTGCKGCPFAKDIQHELEILEEFFPEERKQCEIIWKPVYDEYRRLRYRLKTPYAHQMTIEEFNKRAELIERSASK